MDYRILTDQAEGMLEAEPWYAAAFSNISSLIMNMLPDLNWAGFYLMRDGRLVVGPFQGKPACIHIGSAVFRPVCPIHGPPSGLNCYTCVSGLLSGHT